jgi:hypothetical protein
MLAEHWWFWAVVAAIGLAVLATEPSWRAGAARVRAAALRGRLVAGQAAVSIDPAPGGPWSETYLPGLLIALWVCASPWIWGYDDVDGAVATDAVTGGTIAAVSLAGVVFPALLALNLFAGLWLTVAPWLVGFGSEDGPAGLSDTIAGILVCVLALRGLTVATARVRAAQPGPVGRIRPRNPR